MRIAVVGTGAMGSIYTGLLASAGHELWAVDRWRAHIEAIRAHGLRVRVASGARTGREHGIAAPFNEAITALVKAREAEALRP